MKDSEERNVTWRAAAAGLAVFYALVVLMNAPAMEENAENMDYGVARDAMKALVCPVARLSAKFRLDFLRRGAARVRVRWLDQEGLDQEGLDQEGLDQEGLDQEDDQQ